MNDLCEIVQTFVLKRTVAFPKTLMFFVAFTTIYSLGIALFKVKVYSFVKHKFFQNLTFGPICDEYNILLDLYTGYT